MLHQQQLWGHQLHGRSIELAWLALEQWCLCNTLWPATPILQVVTVEEYDLYCHYVAGVVGIGLSQLFGKWTTMMCHGL